MLAKKKHIINLTALFFPVVASYSPAALVVIDDNGGANPASATINGAVFRLDGPDAGTGTINPELFKVHGTGSATEERGHNGSSDNNDATFTNTLVISAVPVVSVSGTDHFSIWMDINEPGGTQRDITLNSFSVFSDSMNNLSYDAAANGNADPGNGDLGTLRYVMSTDTLNIDDFSQGNNDNKGDLQILIPVANFAGASTNDNVYIWARLGDIGGGDEEFSVITDITGETQTFLPPGTVVVPEPSPVMFGGLLIALLAGKTLFRRLHSMFLGHSKAG